VIPGYEGYSFFVKVDQETLKAVAQITGGQYFYAASADELKAAYAGLHSKLSLETRRTEISFVALSAMLILALVAIVISRPRIILTGRGTGANQTS
jgi:Ca-activated chloride channel family protein